MKTDKNTIAMLIALLAQTINSATTTSGKIIDTAGAIDVNLSVSLDAYTSGNLKVQIFESDDSGMAGATLIAASNIHGDQYDENVTAPAALQTFHYSLHRTMFKQFVQVRVVSSTTPVYNVHGSVVLGSLVRSRLNSDQPFVQA